jgi:hypothetical protein
MVYLFSRGRPVRPICALTRLITNRGQTRPDLCASAAGRPDEINAFRFVRLLFAARRPLLFEHIISYSGALAYRLPLKQR